jgi:hypothetical protein
MVGHRCGSKICSAKGNVEPNLSQKFVTRQPMCVKLR